MGGGVVYALDLVNNRIVRYDSTTGAYLSDFAVTDAEAFSALAVSSNNRLYMTTGDGGGDIFDATTGSLLNTFEATSGTPDSGSGGRDALYLDQTSGYLYNYDQATGMHVFYDVAAVPEPSIWAMIIFGAGALFFLGRRTRKGALSRASSMVD